MSLWTLGRESGQSMPLKAGLSPQESRPAPPPPPAPGVGPGVGSRLRLYAAGSSPAAASSAAAPSPESQANNMAAAIAGLTSFIPAESVTLFVAATNVFNSWKTDSDGLFLWSFGILLVLSPVFYFATAVGTARSEGRKFSFNWKIRWRLVAFFIAFIIWGFAISFETLNAVLHMFRVTLDATAAAHLREGWSLAVILTSFLLSSVDRLVPE